MEKIQRDVAVRMLREMPRMRQEAKAARKRAAQLELQVERMEEALGCLTCCERDIIEKMIVSPVPRASEEICEKYGIERAAVYRRRNRGLQKFGIYLKAKGDKRETNLLPAGGTITAW